MLLQFLLLVLFINFCNRRASICDSSVQYFSFREASFFSYVSAYLAGTFPAASKQSDQESGRMSGVLLEKENCLVASRGNSNDYESSLIPENWLCITNGKH